MPREPPSAASNDVRRAPRRLLHQVRTGNAMRFTTFSEENSLEEAGKWCGLGPRAAAAQLVSELAELDSLLGDRRRFTSAANLAKARAVALAKLTPEERSAKARAAALARYSKSPERGHPLR